MAEEKIDTFAQILGFLSKDKISVKERKEINHFLSLLENVIKETEENSPEREMFSIIFNSVLQNVVKYNHMDILDNLVNIGEKISTKTAIASISLYWACHALKKDTVKHILDNYTITPDFLFQQSTFTDITVGTNMDIVRPTNLDLDSTLQILDLLSQHGVDLNHTHHDNRKSQLFNALMYGKYGIREQVATHLAEKYQLQFDEKEYERILTGQAMEVAFLLNKKTDLIQTVKRNNSIQVKKSQFTKQQYQELEELGYIDKWNALLEQKHLNDTVTKPTTIKPKKHF